MLCCLAQPHEAASLALVWGSWVIIDFLVTQLVGRKDEARALVAIIIVLVVIFACGSCKTPREVHKEKNDRLLRTHAKSTPYTSINNDGQAQGTTKQA
jgi:hypothetical protein